MKNESQLMRKAFLNRLAEKVHLGDGLYAHHDGYHIILTAPREGGDHYVGLEPAVLAAFDRYRKNICEIIENFRLGDKDD